MSRQARRQVWWFLEVLGTALAGFAATGSVAVAISADDLPARVCPAAVAAVGVVLVVLLVRTRSRRWQTGRVS